MVEVARALVAGWKGCDPGKVLDCAVRMNNSQELRERQRETGIALEVLAEKLRTILQRGYPRDVYDTWYLLTYARDQIDLRRTNAVFQRKCAYKSVQAGDVDHFFEVLEEKNTAGHWTASLGAQIRNLPLFEQLQVGLRAALTRLLES